MPLLEIHRSSGPVETRRLSRKAPLLVGHSAASDIRVADAHVAPVHCRISWKQGQYEVAAATAEGVDWNGTLVMQAPLSAGDVIRVADIDLIVRAADDDSNPPGESRRETPAARRPAAPPEAERSPDDSYLLKAVSSQELPVRSFRMSEELRASPPAPEAPPPPKVVKVQSPLAAILDEDFEVPEPPGGRSRVPTSISPGERARHESGALPPPSAQREPARPETGVARIKQRLQMRPRRPGEQDVLRSPLVIGLEVAALLLVLGAVTIWFVLNREAAQREFDIAQAQLESGQYAQAIESFELFLRDRSGHRLSEAAQFSIATARVDQPIAGAAPAWDAGLKALDQFISQYRDREDFQNPESPARRFVIDTADRIALGAAETARTTRKRPPLAVSAEAVKLLELYSPAESRPAERLAEIAATTRAAETAIVRQEAFDEVGSRFELGLNSDSPLAALAAFRKLLDRYPMAQDDKSLKERLRKALDLVRRKTVRDDERREPLRGTEGIDPAVPTLTLAHRTSSRADAPSVGEIALVAAEDCLFGVDATTGEPLWRRPIGLDPPFPPLAVTVGVPAALVYDSRRGELALLQQRSGEPLWRLPLSDRPHGSPLIFEGQALVVTEGGSLEQVDLQSGVGNGRLTFLHGLVGPPVVSLSGERLYVPSADHLLYVLTRRPLACEQVVWLGHGPGSIDAPPLMMRSYLLLAENDRGESARLRLFETAPENQPPRQIADHRVEGAVRDSLAIRGKQLVVASVPERITAWTVAETGDQNSLAFVAGYQVKNPRPVPMFLSVGPDDQFWSTSSALRRFTITRDSLLPSKQELAIGLASQPLQGTGDSLYVGRRQPFSRAVLLSEVDRQRMATLWQTAMGSPILAGSAPTADGPTLLINDLGELFQVAASRMARSGFEMQTLGQVPVPEEFSGSLRASRLADGRLAVHCGGDKPRLWIVGGDGIPRDVGLTKPLEAEPISLGPGVLLPLEGRLRLVIRDGRQAIADDLPSPTAETGASRWRSVTALDDSQALAVNDQGRLARVQFRSAPVAHLAEITHWDAGRSIDQKPAVSQGRAVVADSSGRVVVLDASSFEPLGQVQLDLPPGQAPWVAGDRVFVELAGSSKLACCQIEPAPALAWELPLDGVALAGGPVVYRNRLLVPLRDGKVLVVEADSGALVKTLDLGQRLSSGLEAWGDRLQVGAQDGSLLLLNDWLDRNL